MSSKTTENIRDYIDHKAFVNTMASTEISWKPVARAMVL